MWTWKERLTCTSKMRGPPCSTYLLIMLTIAIIVTRLAHQAHTWVINEGYLRITNSSPKTGEERSVGKIRIHAPPTRRFVRWRIRESISSFVGPKDSKVENPKEIKLQTIGTRSGYILIQLTLLKRQESRENNPLPTKITRSIIFVALNVWSCTFSINLKYEWKLS